MKEKVENIEVNRMRNIHIIDTLTSVDTQEIVKIGRKVFRIYEGAFIKKISRYHHLEKL